MTTNNILTNLKIFGDRKIYRAFVWYCLNVAPVMCLTCVCESVVTHMSVSHVSKKSKMASGSGGAQ